MIGNIGKREPFSGFPYTTVPSFEAFLRMRVLFVLRSCDVGIMFYTIILSLTMQGDNGILVNSDIPGSSSGRTLGFGPKNGGSTPPPGAKLDVGSKQ